ncbi:MAG TPA: hypothetical protein VET85_10680 [Stellaceae bacterium]|nr:hypothetical protein [Stellaceae bacterium]
MAEGKGSWIDYANLVMSVALSVIGIGVAVLVSRSADRLSANGLMVTTATFLLDDSEKRQTAGVEIYKDLVHEHIALPPWSDSFISHFLDKPLSTPAPSSLPSTVAPPTSTPSTPEAAIEPQPAPPRTTTPAPRPAAAEQLFTALAGAVPRLFIEISDEAQRPGADALRRAIGQVQLGGQTVIAPGVEKVKNVVKRVELRFLKNGDGAEAQQLADALGALLAEKVWVSDLSKTYDSPPNVKPRTYELWFPADQPIAVKTSGA